jgi:hypothetical protein
MQNNQELDSQMSQDVEKTIFPLKILWIALSASLLVYAFVIFKVLGISFVDVKQVDTMKSTILPFSYLPFVFTFLVFTKKEWVLRKFFLKGNRNLPYKSKVAPYLKGMTEEDQQYLSEFSPYFIFHILMLAINDSGAILGFVLTFSSGNFSYYLLNGSIALAFNILLFKPNYKKFKQSLG